MAWLLRSGYASTKPPSDPRSYSYSENSLAAAGQHELFIRKTEADGRTYTRIDPLDEEGRTREIARLLAGENITDSVLAAARELLGEYREI